MRADQQRLQIRIAARPPSDEVARGVDDDVQFRLAHQLHRVFAASPVGLGIRQTMRPAFRRFAELRKLDEAGVDAKF